MKLLYSGYVLPITATGRSVSVWKSKVRSGDRSVVVIQHRNQMEKNKIREFVEHFEEHSPHEGESGDG